MADKSKNVYVMQSREKDKLNKNNVTHYTSTENSISYNIKDDKNAKKSSKKYFSQIDYSQYKRTPKINTNNNTQEKESIANKRSENNNNYVYGNRRNESNYGNNNYRRKNQNQNQNVNNSKLNNTQQEKKEEQGYSYQIRLSLQTART